MSLHIGLHWKTIIGVAGTLWNRKKTAKGRAIIFQVVVLSISLYGVYAFIHRKIGSYMFLQNQFVFFDFRESRIVFFTDYLAMMCLFAICGYYSSKGIELFVGRRKRI